LRSVRVAPDEETLAFSFGPAAIGNRSPFLLRFVTTAAGPMLLAVPGASAAANRIAHPIAAMAPFTQIEDTRRILLALALHLPNSVGGRLAGRDDADNTNAAARPASVTQT